MIEIIDLSVTDSVGRRVLDQVDLRIGNRERVALVGESGSGKTTLALAMLGQIRSGLSRCGGQVLVDGQPTLDLPTRAVRRLRREVIAYLPQDPAASLSPRLRVAAQLGELSGDHDPGRLRSQLQAVGLPHDDRFLRRWPHQLSGGQRQRLALARAVSGAPRLLVLDEPTTGLDALVRARVLDEIDDLATTRGVGLLLITHDLSAAAQLADRVVVMREGRVVEEGPVGVVLHRPRSGYTRELAQSALSLPHVSTVGSGPVADAEHSTATADTGGGRPPQAPPAVQVSGLSASYGSGVRRSVVLDDISLELAGGECLAVLGLSGSGKTTLARCLAGQHVPDAGVVHLEGRPMAADIRGRTGPDRRRLQIVPQDAPGSLSPRRSVGGSIARPLALRGLAGTQVDHEVERLLGLVDLDPGLAVRRPHQLSGGQAQRVAIARALACDPAVLVCDEMTASLDLRVQAGILDLVDRLRHELRLAVVLVSHDLGVVSRLAQRTIVLRSGRIVDSGPSARVLLAPRDALTRDLVDAARAGDQALRAVLDRDPDPDLRPVTATLPLVPVDAGDS